MFLERGRSQTNDRMRAKWVAELLAFISAGKQCEENTYDFQTNASHAGKRRRASIAQKERKPDYFIAY